jgi:putative ATP-dependent endonuclease of OLD family
MKLVSMTIKNFRSYANETNIRFDDLTTIIGKNDIGKSTIMEALEIFFNNNTVKIDPSDKNAWSDNHDIEITCEFTDLPSELVLDITSRTTLEAEFLLSKDKTLRILKRYSAKINKPKESVFAIALHPSNNLYSDLLDLTNAKLKDRMTQLSINTEGVSKSINNLMRKAIWASCDELKLEEREVALNSDETKKIWEALKLYLPQFALYQSDRASKDSDSEVQDPMKNAIAEILSSPDIQMKLDEIVAIVQKAANEIANATHSVLRMLNKDLANQLVPDFKNDPKWSSLFSLTLKDENNIAVNKKGSGVRRMILISFLIAEANRKRENDQKSNIIYAIEEPETSQHPYYQKMLLNALNSLSTSDGCQVVLTTHSPGLTSMLPLSSFRFIKRDDKGLPIVIENGDEMYSEIVADLGIVPDSRVRVLLCLEGPCDVEALKCFSRVLYERDKSLINLDTDPRVAFVPLGGGQLKHWVEKQYLKELNRPEFHLYDSDDPKYKKSVDEVNNRSDGSKAFLTKKLMIENYLHPDVVSRTMKIDCKFSDSDNVPELISSNPNSIYKNISTIKQRLANYAFPRMTAELLDEVDPVGEIKQWLLTIREMVESTNR